MKQLSSFIFESFLESQMKKRVKDHIERVKYFYNKLIELGLISEEDIIDINMHDKDKFEPKNLKRQALRFKEQRSTEEAKQINDVIREHIKSNPHHCEYWGRKDQDHLSKYINCEKMPDKYLYEMIADWHSTAEERGNTVMDYFYDVNGERFIFSKRQQEIIKKCTNALEKFVDSSKKREYSTVYIDPAKK